MRWGHGGIGKSDTNIDNKEEIDNRFQKQKSQKKKETVKLHDLMVGLGTEFQFSEPSYNKINFRRDGEKFYLTSKSHSNRFFKK